MSMLPIRIYIAALTLVLTLVCVCTGNVGIGEYVVTGGPLLYMILEMREELTEIESLERRLLGL